MIPQWFASLDVSFLFLSLYYLLRHLLCLPSKRQMFKHQRCQFLLSIIRIALEVSSVW